MIIFVASLAGCGGGGSSSSTGGAEADSKANTPAKLSELQERADAVREQRRKAAAADGGEGSRQGSSPDPHPQREETQSQSQAAEETHADSGGGAGQFRTAGDNSIQEFGQEADAAARADAAAVLHEYLDARVDGRWGTACSLASASLVVSLEHVGAVVSKGKGLSSCPEMLAAFGRGTAGGASSRVAEVDVGSLRVKGERGFVLFHGPGGIDYAMPMVREAGLWKIGSLEGAPLP